MSPVGMERLPSPVRAPWPASAPLAPSEARPTFRVHGRAVEQLRCRARAHARAARPGLRLGGPILHDVAMGMLVCVATLAALEWPRARFALAAPALWLLVAGRAAPERQAAAAELLAGALLLLLSAVPSARLGSLPPVEGRGDAGARA